MIKEKRPRVTYICAFEPKTQGIVAHDNFNKYIREQPSEIMQNLA
jgi:hypothetical protein